jgi:O-antigen/teichoic acid export membrane protein
VPEDGRAQPSEPNADRDSNPQGTDVLRRVARSAAFMIAGRLVVRSLSIVSMLLIARLLLPEDFGLVALAAAAIAFAEVLSVTNYALVLVRRPDVTRDLYDAAWTLNLLRSLLLGSIVAASAHWQAAWLGDERVAAILMVVALGIALDGFTSIGMARLQRELRFDLIFRFQVIGKLVAFAFAIFFALILQNYWCLVLGNLAAKVVCVPYSYSLAPHRPRPTLRGAGQLMQFSGWMLTINLLTTADAHGSNMMLGRWAGVQALGSYQMAYFLAAVPVHEVGVPVRQPIYSGYAQVQHDMAMLRRHFLGGFGLIATLLIPLSVGIAVTAPLVGRIALGPSWSHVTTLIVLCALYSLVEAMAAFSTNVFFVLDRLKPYVRTLAILVGLRLPLVLLGVMYWGALGMAVVMLATALPSALLWHSQVCRLLGHRLRDVAAETWRSLAAAGVMAVVVLAVSPPGDAALMGLGEALHRFIVLAVFGAVTHVGSQALLWWLSGRPDGAELRVIDLARRALRTFRSRRDAAI